MLTKTVPPLRSARALRCAVSFLALSLAAIGAAPAATDVATVAGTLRTTWYHGITEEVAQREVGPDGVPALLELLADPDYPRRDNVVAFLHHLAGPEATAAMVAFLEAPPAAPWVPEEDRALLLAPRALGAIAARGDVAALDALLAMTDPVAGAGPIDRAVETGALPPGMRADLVEQALAGLAIAGHERAFRRLERFGAGERPPGVSRDLRRAADRAVRGVVASTSVGFDGDVGDEPGVGFLASIEDPSATSHETPLTYTNHVDHDNPMTDARLDLVLARGTELAAIGDFDTDVACCLRFVRSGNGDTFGSPGDGLDTIDDESDLTQALASNRGKRVKVVRLISWCGEPGINIIGCAYTPGNGMAVVRNNSIDVEGALWVHEYGHNAGLFHNPDIRFIMAATANGRNNGLSESECATYHAPPFQTGITLTDIGTCHDDDLDDVASSLDNCPDVANRDQIDTDGDGTGDACEGAVGCVDTDADGYGNPGNIECLAGAATDCDDADAAVYPDAAELCDGVDNDCDGSSDELTCDELDGDADGRVDGRDLASMGRAFGLCHPDPASQWWAALDLDRDGCVDGQDLAVLATGWGCEGVAAVCD